MVLESGNLSYSVEKINSDRLALLGIVSYLVSLKRQKLNLIGTVDRKCSTACAKNFHVGISVNG